MCLAIQGSRNARACAQTPILEPRGGANTSASNILGGPANIEQTGDDVFCNPRLKKSVSRRTKTSVAEHAARIHLLQTCSRRREQRKKGAVKPTPCVKKDAVKPTPCVNKKRVAKPTRPEKKAMTYACALWRLRLAFPAAARFAAAALMAAGPASSFKYATRRSQTASGASDFEAHGRGAPKCTRKP